MKTLNTLTTQNTEPKAQNLEHKTLLQPADVPATYADVAGLMEDFDYDLTANPREKTTPINAKPLAQISVQLAVKILNSDVSATYANVTALIEDFEYRPSTSQKTTFLNILSTFEHIIWILQYQ